MTTSRDAVATLYGKIAEYEDLRLATHPMEREVTLRTIRHGLSGDGSVASKRIADIGGGPGKLAFALADEGHEVDLIDLSPDLIQLAQDEQDRRATVSGKQQLTSIGVGNALDDSGLDKDSYDAVLLLGPLYHLLDEAERVQAVQNALQLAKSQGGLVFCAFVGIEAHLRDLVSRDPARLLKEKEFYDAYLASGRYERVNEAAGTTAQSFHTNSSHVRLFFQQHFSGTLELIGLRSTEGILGGGLDKALIDADPAVVKTWADLMFENYSEQERHLGCADHLLAVLRRKCGVS
ncbi:S-adenosyl-L-methionine-dependent methyltransferase [Microdochium bolleyi]|uniref:S-adenosyl-L-methionine-dependent methyltransferase n=1 Tax=Microdochium bolleyi TaxID=196109 RepID=A0A136IQ06_9PEZI|nr:S-adenosyl-L-methionine-dependent methyltransferase [Microdochium bolleyi]